MDTINKENLINLTKKTYQLTLLFPKQEPLRRRIREAADDILAGIIMFQRNKNSTSLLNGYFEVIDSFLEVALNQNWTASGAISELKNSYAALKTEFEQNNINLIAESKKLPPEIDQLSAPASELLQENFKESDEEKSAEGEKGEKEEEEEEEEKEEKEEKEKEKKEDEEKKEEENIIYAPPAPVLPLIRQLSGLENKPAPIESVAYELQDEKPRGADGGLKNIKEELTESQIARQNRIIEFLKQKGRAQVWEIQKIFPDISKRTIRRDFRSLLEQGLIERVGERNKTYYKMKVHFS